MLANILFVDDEIQILNALKRMLRGKRDEWNCFFADGGASALEFLSQKDFDVVVSDMRMPGMDGAQLLKEIHKKFPATIRIILSGFAEENSILNTISSAHQYLAKPCDKDQLINTLTRALSLRTYLDKTTANCIIGKMTKLPTLPDTLKELMDEIDSPNSNINRLDDIVSKDIALTAQTLRITNSAFFGVPVEVTSPGEAIRFLGIDTFRSIALSAGIFKELVHDRNIQQRSEKLNQNCMEIGALATKICQREGTDIRTTNFAKSASTLSHIGTLILMSEWGEIYDQLLAVLDTNGGFLVYEESRAFGVSHAELGAYVLGLWGFPDPIVEAVAFHHCPSKADNSEFGPLAILHVAQCLVCRDFDANNLDAIDTSKLDLEYLERVGVMGKLKDWSSLLESVRNVGRG